jgi:hypothetical protein
MVLLMIGISAYDLSGLSTTDADCVDGFTLLAQRALSAHTATSELSGARIDAVLDRSEVDWPASLRDIDTGAQTLQADVVADGTNVLEYLQVVTDTEPGSIFIGADGFFVFKDRSVAPVSSGLVTFSDDGTGVEFSDVQVVYGSELLYNYVQVERNNGGTAIVFDTDINQLLWSTGIDFGKSFMNSDADALELANYLLSQYSEPEYRFETLTVKLEALSSGDQADV